MKINVATLGELFLGATYDLTFTYTQGMDGKYVFTGVKYNPRDKSYSVWFQYATGEFKGNELGFSFGMIAIADLCEPVAA